MAALNIRGLRDDVHAKLRVRAAMHGRSMEAEARAILEAAVAPDDGGYLSAADLQEFVDSLYARPGSPPRPASAVDDLLAERRAEARAEEEAHLR